MRIIFAGSPKEVIAPLKAIQELSTATTHELVAVISQPAKATGRRKKLLDPALAEYAKKAGIEVLQPESAKDAEFLSTLKKLQPDIIITAAYGQILTDEFLAIPKRATINIHPSCLPAFRGATPVPSALLEGCDHTGVTVLFTVKKLDAGPIICMKKTPIEPNETAGNLTERLFNLGAELLPRAIELLADPVFQGEEQEEHVATHCKKLSKNQGLIVWSDTAKNIHNRFRAFHPWPGSYTYLNGRRITIELMSIIPHSETKAFHQQVRKPGYFFYDNSIKAIVVACLEEEFVAIHALKPEGRNCISAHSFINGQKGLLDGEFQHEI